MTSLDTSSIRYVLAERRQALLTRWRRDLTRESERRGVGKPQWRGLASPGCDMRYFARLAHSKARELGEIIAAMRRLDHGTYGTCVKCCRAIEEVRLRGFPEARTCMRCIGPVEGAPCTRS